MTWKDHFPHWRAWYEWRRDALGRHAYGQAFTVPFAWPPATGEEVLIYLELLTQWQKEIRDEAYRLKLARTPPLTSVPTLAPVWQPWPHEKRRQVGREEIMRREQRGPEFHKYDPEKPRDGLNFAMTLEPWRQVLRRNGRSIAPRMGGQIAQIENARPG